MDSSIFRKTNEEIEKLSSVIQAEKKTREESEQSIYEMLRDVVNRVKAEIDAERKER